jgi:hypothetical protein
MWGWREVAKVTKHDMLGFFLGWMALLALKYVVFGLTAWNNIFHPGLIPAPNQQAYLQPWLGIFNGGSQQ